MNEILYFFSSTELIRIHSDAVAYITANGNYSTIKMTLGHEYVLTQQLGQMEKHISEMVKEYDNRFVRIGKSLIVNRDHISYINPTRQKITLSDGKSFNYELTASKDALKLLKLFIEKQIEK